MKRMILPAPVAGLPREVGDGGLEPARVSPDFIERVMLLVSELATNSVGHGNPPAGASVELSMRVEPHCIWWEMRDPAPGFEANGPRPAPGPAGPGVSQEQNHQQS